MNKIKQLINKMENDDLMAMYQLVKQEINDRMPQDLTSADKIAELLIQLNRRNVTSSEISSILNMPSSTVRRAIREKLVSDKRFNVYLNRKPLEISYNGGRMYR